MKNFLLYISILFSFTTKAQVDYVVNIKNTGIEIVGEIDAKDKNRINFYFQKLNLSTSIELILPKSENQILNDKVEGCFLDVENNLLKCHDFEVINNKILIANIDYKELYENKFALRLVFKEIAPLYFVFILSK